MMLNMIFYFSLLCPGSDNFKNERSYTSSHHNVQTDTLPLPCFIITRTQMWGDYSCIGICGIYFGEMTGVQNFFWLLQHLLIPHTPTQVDYTASWQFYALNFLWLPRNKTMMDTDPFTQVLAIRIWDKCSLYKIITPLCRDSIF